MQAQAEDPMSSVDPILQEQMMNMSSTHCRFCAEPKKYSEILDLSGDGDTLQQYLLIINFFKIDYLNLSQSELPKTTCEECYNQFQNAYEFFIKVKQSQIILETLYNNCNIKCEMTRTTIIKVEQESTSQCDLEQLPINPANTELTDYFDSESSTVSESSNTDIVEFSPKYGGVSVFDSDVQEDVKLDGSWTSYPWACRHCAVEFNEMDEVRAHSRELHGMCYGFDCVDCDDQFNTFNSFVEHIRQHRDELRYFCPHCNTKFESWSQCADHALTHWTGTQKICDLCGEICPDADTLERHKKLYKQVTLPRREYRKKPKQVVPGFTYNGVPVFQQHFTRSWAEYDWTCQECCVRAPDVDSLRAHAQEFHNKCFAMKCADCLKVLRNYRMFTAHVAAHRPYLKKFCQYCNKHFDNTSTLTEHINNHMSGVQKPCDGCGQVFENNNQLLSHIRRFNPPRRRGTLTTDDLTCDLCNKMFKNMGQLRSHRKTHEENRKRDHICHTCGKGFFSVNMLAAHVEIHSTQKREVCQACDKEFSSKAKLRAHVLTHVELEQFTCDECGKSFQAKKKLKSHIAVHIDEKRFKCLVCSKEFKFKTNLNTHMNLHTGLRPYACQQCEKTFANWSNCNKHMIRKHGVTLAKTKLTSQGRIAINQETGKAKKLASDKKVIEWMDQVINPSKRSKKTDKIV